MNPISIILPKSAVIGPVEEQFEKILVENLFEMPIVIDLSEVVFIEIATMVYLAQFISQRTKKTLQTKFILPKSDEVMTTLHTWRFFEILEELTDKSIADFLVSETERFRKLKIEIEGKTYYKDINNDYFEKYYSDKGIQSLVKKGFFSLICIPFKTAKEKRYALKSQRLQWTSDTLISDVLERNLLKNIEVGNLFASTIIYECLTNAARHPKSNNLVIGSFFDFKKRSKKEEKSYHFTVVLWDNGKSIISTLKDSINEGENIRSNESFSLAERNGLTLSLKLKRLFDSNSINSYLFYDFIPTKDTTEEDILVSSFLPGISRDPSRKHKLLENADGTIEPEEIGDEELKEKYGPGLGLTNLLDAAVNQLRGEIAVRTKEFFLNIKSAGKNVIDECKMISKKPVDSIYQAKLAKHPNPNYEFVGNMITIRIPLKYSA